MAAVSVKRSIDKKKYYQWRTIYTYPHFFVFLSPISLQITLKKDADLGNFNKLRAAQFLLKIIHNDYFEAMWAVRLRTSPVTPFMAPLKNYESALVVDIEICTMDIILEQALLLFSVFESPIIPSAFSKAPTTTNFA